MIKYMKSQDIILSWSNITNYMKYDKRLLYNSFKYIVILEEFFKSMLANNSEYEEQDLLTMEFSTALKKLVSLNKKIEFADIDFELLKKEKGAIISFRNAVVHNKMLLDRKFRGSDEFQKKIPGKTLKEILDIYEHILPNDYKLGFTSDIFNCSKHLDIDDKLVFFKSKRLIDDNNPTISKMLELERIINYRFNDINLLEHAMNSTALGNDNHVNDALATVGDAILKSMIADYLYKNVSQTKGDITQLKSNLENNSTLHNVEMNTGIINYAHNEKHFYGDVNTPDNERVVCREHDSYLEAIVGAIYYDSSYNSAKKWFGDYLRNELDRYKVEKKNG